MEDDEQSNLDDAPKFGSSFGSNGPKLESNFDNAPKFGDSFGSNAPKTESNLDNAPKFGDSFGSNGPKAAVAEAYEPALSGAKGPEARFDAIQEIAGNRVEESMNSMMFSSSGGTNISGFGGMFTVASQGRSGTSAPIVADGVDLPRVPWSLQYDGELEQYFISYPGKVLWGFGDLDNEATLTDITNEVTVSGGGGIFLHLEGLNLDVPTLTLKSGDFWLEHPKTFKEETVDFVDEVTEAWFLLWEFFNGTLPAEDFGVQINEDTWGRQLNRTPTSVMIWGIHNPDANNTRMAVPVLVPLA